VAKTQYFCAATLDGHIADDDDRIDWLSGLRIRIRRPGEKVLDAIDSYIDGIGALVMGSSTYEFIPRPRLALRRPPDVGADQPQAAGHRGCRHPAFTTAPSPTSIPRWWSPPATGTLWVVGGGPVASDLVEADLLDELLLTVVPIVLGSGKPCFSRPIDKGMTLLGTRPSPTE